MNYLSELDIQIIAKDSSMFDKLIEKINDLIRKYILEDNIENEIIKNFSDDKVCRL